MGKSTSHSPVSVASRADSQRELDRMKRTCSAIPRLFTGAFGRAIGVQNAVDFKNELTWAHVSAARKLLAWLKSHQVAASDFFDAATMEPGLIAVPWHQVDHVDRMWDLLSDDGDVTPLMREVDSVYADLVGARESDVRGFDRLVICDMVVVVHCVLSDMLPTRTVKVDRGLCRATCMIVSAAMEMLRWEVDDQHYVHRLVALALARARTSALEALARPAEVKAEEEPPRSLWNRVCQKLASKASGWPSRRGKPPPKPGKPGEGKWTRVEWLRRRFSAVYTPQDAQRQQLNAAGPVAEGKEKDSDSPTRLSKMEQIEQRRARRDKRDAEQRAAAEAKVKAAYKSKSKEDRKKFVLSQRDKRSGIEPQSGIKVLELTKYAGAVFAGALACKFVIKGARVVASVAEFFEQKTIEMVGVIKSVLGKWWLVPAGLALHAVFMEVCKNGSSAMMLTTITAVIAKVLGQPVWKHVAAFFRLDGVTPQAGIGNVGKLFGFLMVASVVNPKKLGSSRTTELMKRVTMLPRAAEGATVAGEWLGEAFDATLKAIYALAGRADTAPQFFKRQATAVELWANNVDQLIQECRTANVATDAELIARLTRLTTEGVSLKQVFRETRTAGLIEKGLDHLYRELMPLTGAINAAKNFRVEPSFCLLGGKPGIGKSLFTREFCTSVLVLSGALGSEPTAELIKKNMYQQGSSEYWNGYAGQTCLVMDDAFQRRGDPQDENNDFMNIIRLVNMWSCPLNFADVESKGKMFFMSKFIMGTTNIRSINSFAALSVNDTSAVFRRIHFPYWVELLPEYKKGEFLDYDAFKAERAKCASQASDDPLDAFPWYMWQARRWDFCSGAPCAEAVPLRTVIEMAASHLQRKLQTHSESETAHDAYAERLIAAYKSGIQPQMGLIGAITQPARFVARVAAGSGGRIKRLAHIGAESATDTWKSQTVKAWARLDALELGRHAIDLAANIATNPSVFVAGAAFMVAGKSIVKLAVRLMDGFRKLVMWLIKQMGKMATCALACLGLDFHKKNKNKKPQKIKHMVAENHKLVTLNEQGEPVQVAWQSNRPLTNAKGSARAQGGAQDVTPQSGNPQHATNAYANSYRLRVVTGPDRTPMSVNLGQVIMLNGTVGVMPAHYRSQLLEHVSQGSLDFKADIVQLRNCLTQCLEVSMSLGDFLGLSHYTEERADVDFVMFRNIRAHRNITSMLIKESQVDYLDGKAVRLELCEDVESAGLKKLERRSYVMPFASVHGAIKYQGVSLDRSVRYPIVTVAGSCGAPLLLVDADRFGCGGLVGFHVAGDTRNSRGYSTILTREMAERAYARLQPVNDVSQDDERFVTYVTETVHDPLRTHSGTFQPLAQCGKPAHTSPNSRLFKTDVYGLVGPYELQPARLKPFADDSGQFVYPMEKAVARYAGPIKCFDQDMLNEAASVAFERLAAMTAGYECRRLMTFEEAVIGVPELKFRSIPRNTSPGFPYVLEGHRGKTAIFGTANDYSISTPDAKLLKRRVDHIVSQAREGKRTFVVYIDFLKDELRSKEKVARGETRLISSAPLDYTVACRMLFGSFVSTVMGLSAECGLAPGICCYTEWDVLANHLLSKGGSVFDGDFKAFDANEQPQILDTICSWINSWYGDSEENQRARRVLFEDLLHSRHLGGTQTSLSHVYQWNRSLPSGHPLTTVVNSMYSLLIITACYIHLTGDKKDFWQHVAAVTYGDDNACGVDEAMRGKFNQRALASAMKELFDLDYTAGHKEAQLVDEMSIDQITFLKRGFRQENGRWLCPLDPDSFLYTYYWCANRLMTYDIVNDGLDNALCELSLHDADMWDKYAEVLYDALRQRMANRGEAPKTPCQRAAYQKKVLARRDNWY